jgi:hypothetical protein
VLGSTAEFSRAASVLGNEFADCGYELLWNLHGGVRIVIRGFVFRNRLVIGLGLVVSKYAPNAGLVPARRESVLVVHRCLLRRRRSAYLAFGESSYAVITKIELGSASGT